MKSGRIFLVIIGIIVGVIIAGGYISIISIKQGRKPDPILVQQMFHLREALLSFRLDYGYFPIGTNAEIAKVLNGSNSQKKNILQKRAYDLKRSR